MLRMKKIDINNNAFKILVFALAISVVFLFAFLFLITGNIVFPCLNGLIMLLSLFIYKQKYRVYSIVFFSFLPSLLSINKYGIPSFVSINVIVYIICILVDLIIFRKAIKRIDFFRVACFILLAIFLLFVCLLNIKDISITKAISGICYLSLPVLFLLDKRAEKNYLILIILFSLAIILTNLFAFAFIYIFKSYSFRFLELFIPDYVLELKVKGYSGFRFPGLIGDSNHNSLNILLATAMAILYSIKFKKWRIFLISNSFLMQMFGFIGGSKTYILCLFLMMFGFIIYYFYVKKMLIIGTSITLLILCFGALFFLNIGIVCTSILRLLNTDSRGGFLESLTTGRLSVWKNYLVAISAKPILAIFGHGVSSVKLFDFHFHSVWLELLWDFGFVGTAIFVYYFYQMFLVPLKNKSILIYFPLIICMFFGLTLHILYDESIYFCFVICILLSDNFKRKEKIKNTTFIVIEI